MKREEMIEHIVSIINEKVDGSAVYHTTSPPGSTAHLDYPVELDAATVRNAAEEISDFISNCITDEDR